MELLHDDVITCYISQFAEKITDIHESVTDGPTDLTDRRTDRLSYIDARMHLVSLINLFFSYESVTDRRTNRRRDGGTDRPTYRDASENGRRIADRCNDFVCGFFTLALGC